MNLNQNKCLNSNTASNITAKVAKPIKNGHKQGRLCMIEFHFFGMQINTLGSLGKIRVGRVTGNTHILFLALSYDLNVILSPSKFVYITKTCPCNIQQYFTVVKMLIFR